LPRYLIIAIGGALGAMLRFSISDFAAHRFSAKFPLGTFFINLSACFLIGTVVAYLNLHTHLSPAWRYAIPTGFIGAYSTFSTYEWEIFQDISRGRVGWGLFYLAASIVLGLLFVAAGDRLGRALP
jgi:CrcB protein